MGAPLPPVFQQSPSHQKEEMHAGGRFCTRQKWNATLRSEGRGMENGGGSGRMWALGG